LPSACAERGQVKVEVKVEVEVEVEVEIMPGSGPHPSLMW
jgi:hypothetical protein